MAEVFFWPALLAYGEAALAYGADVRRPGRPGRLATWGVRLGWLAQTGLLVVQAARADGFPWTSWAGALNLFVWLVVGAYLIWGCRARYRLLGLAVMPLAAVLLAVAWAGGGTGTRAESQLSDLFLVLHVGLVLAAFAGFTLAAALAALYVFQERRLKRREASILRLPAPSLAALDRFAGRTIAFSLPTLTLGIGVGLARLAGSGGSFDAVMAATLATWAAYACFVALRYGAGWRGRRSAYLSLAGFAFVLVVLPIGHFS
ncbi:MAG: cytochrome c biogenesis protein CcsA [Actinomycetota bacterium]|nr:cytochrome c biogenesis protein CcsA [Actinomycetota bacterium]